MSANRRLRRFLLGVQYDGSKYSGWSDQIPIGRVKPGLVYQLKTRLNQFVKNKHQNFGGSSRTDAGVHAIRNTFHLDLDFGEGRDSLQHQMTPEKFLRGFNSHLLKDDDIHILDCQEVPLSFHSRHHATSRTYMYRLMTTSNNLKLPKQWIFQNSHVWFVKRLDVAAMKQAAQHLIGIHDFEAFRNRDCQSKSTYRHVWRIDIETHNCNPENFLINDPFLLGSHQLTTITITGNSFLYRMVRNIVGTLVAVGHGKISPDIIPDLLASRDRTTLPPLAPPEGLFLVNVTYNKEDTELVE